jgi:hypothetical protein
MKDDKLKRGRELAAAPRNKGQLADRRSWLHCPNTAGENLGAHKASHPNSLVRAGSEPFANYRTTLTLRRLALCGVRGFPGALRLRSSDKPALTAYNLLLTAHHNPVPALRLRPIV